MTKPKLRMHADGQVSVYLADGFANFMSGIGAANLKSSGNSYGNPIPSQELEAAYRTSTWFGKIVDIPADDSVREWRTWQLDKDLVTKIEAEERRLGVRDKVRQARIWQRLYGGAALVLGGLSGEVSQEVRLDSIRKGALKFISVVPKDELRVSEVRRNPLDPFFGQPDYYELQSSGVGEKIHPSRVIAFRGIRVSPLSSGVDFWGDSIWYRLEDAIKSADSSGAVLDALLQEAKVDVLRVSGMMKGMATAEYEALMIRRFQMVAILKGMQNVMMLDKDDEWEQKQITWTGLPDVGKHILNILSGASDIPMFRLTGQNLTGLSNSGEGETRAYYDSVNADQNLDLRPTLDPFDSILVRSALGSYPEDTWYSWNSLYQMTDKEKSEIDKAEAETASIYAASGLIPLVPLGKAVQARMIESGRWAALEQALEENKVDEEKEDQTETEALTALLSKLQAAQGGPGGQEQGTPSTPGMVADVRPRTLYVSRKVLNWRDIAAHFKTQGFKTTVGEEMHVTIVYSRTPLDWMKVGATWDSELKIPAGGPRTLEAFGAEGKAKVLAFTSHDLVWRHRAALEAGASYDFDEYQPHITISYGDLEEGRDLDSVEPWTGEILLGPEIFKEIQEDWKETLTEDQKNG